MPTKVSTKTCFVIAPIGEEGSETRKRSDQVLKHIIVPALEQMGYEPIRADKIDKPGLITAQVIDHLIEAPLVIADLTERAQMFFTSLRLGTLFVSLISR